MNGFVSYLIIGCCIVVAVAGAVLFALDFRHSQRAARKRAELVSRIFSK